jgi:hypothetical protein
MRDDRGQWNAITGVYGASEFGDAIAWIDRMLPARKRIVEAITCLNQKPFNKFTLHGGVLLIAVERRLRAPDSHSIYRSGVSILKLDLGECSALPKDSASLAFPSQSIPDKGVTEGVGVIRLGGLA